MMLAIFIEDIVTPVTLPELCGALVGGHRQTMGSDFETAQAAANGFAQLCLECGNGANGHRNNWHNEKLGSDWTGLFTRYRCDEIFDAQTSRAAQHAGPPGSCFVTPWHTPGLFRCVLTKDHPWSSFIAFDGDSEDPAKRRIEGAAKGGARYIEFLSCRERYRKAWLAMRHGTPVEFTHELRAAGYMTADEDVYARGLASIAARSMPLCEATLAGQVHELTADDSANISALVSLTCAETIWMPDRHQELTV